MESKDNFLSYSDPFFTVKADVSELKNHLRSSEETPLAFDFVGGWEINPDGVVETKGYVESNEGKEEHTLKGCVPVKGFAEFDAEMSVVYDALLIDFDRGAFDSIGKLDIKQTLGVGEYAPRHFNEEFVDDEEELEDGDGAALILQQGPSCFEFLYDYQNNDYFAGSAAIRSSRR